jgi:hypothetical protein
MQHSGAFEQTLNNAAPAIALEMEAKGQRWTPEVIAAVIACVLAKTRSDLQKIENRTSLLLPYLQKHPSEPREQPLTNGIQTRNTQSLCEPVESKSR